jgi:hypothetical protein
MGQTTSPVPDRFRSALSLLLSAYDYALDCQADPWQFAVAFTELIEHGATVADIRWLILRGYAAHARETTIPGDKERTFRQLAPTCFPPDLCVALAPTATATIRSLLETSNFTHSHGKDFPSSSQGRSGGRPSLGAHPVTPQSILKPLWDQAHRELRYNGQVVKRYRVPAANQQAILDAFEEDGWPEFIDDPIPPDGDQDPKRRLNVTIKSLNRNQIISLIRFHGNGNGLQIHWEAVNRC